MKNVLLAMALPCCMLNGLAQTEEGMFPSMETVTATNTKINIPEDAGGKYTLIGLAYSQKSEKELQEWYEPVFYKFIHKPTGFWEGLGYDVNLYFIPMFTGINTVAADMAKKMVLEKIDPQLLPHILFYKGDIKKYKKELSFEKRDTPYFFVLNPEGKIVYTTSGKYEEEKMDQVENVIE